MEMTLDIPDDVLKRATLKAVQEGVTLRELVARAIQNDLETQASLQQKYLRLRPEQRRQVIREEGKRLAEYYATHPDDALPDCLDADTDQS